MVIAVRNEALFPKILLLIISTTKTVSSLQLWDCEQQGPGQMVFITQQLQGPNGVRAVLQLGYLPLGHHLVLLKMAFHS
jgi:hypothetical protein